jgi:hypothetical protein
VRPDANKNGQISPLGRRSGCQDYGRRPRRQAVLSKRGNSAKIHPGLGFIWGIPAKGPVLALSVLIGGIVALIKAFGVE